MPFEKALLCERRKEEALGVVDLSWLSGALCEPTVRRQLASDGWREPRPGSLSELGKRDFCLSGALQGERNEPLMDRGR